MSLENINAAVSALEALAPLALPLSVGTAVTALAAELRTLLAERVQVELGPPDAANEGPQ
jgi:hypothetical protein